MITYVLSNGDWVEGAPVAGEKFKRVNSKGGELISYYAEPEITKLPTAEEIAYLGVKITTRAFMQRFTQPERTAIRKSTDDIVIDIHEDLKALIGRHVVLNDPDAINALAYLTGVGILVDGRSDTILNTPVTAGET